MSTRNICDVCGAEADQTTFEVVTRWGTKLGMFVAPVNPNVRSLRHVCLRCCRDALDKLVGPSPFSPVPIGPASPAPYDPRLPNPGMPYIVTCSTPSEPLILDPKGVPDATH